MSRKPDSEAADRFALDEEASALRDCMGELETRSRSICWLHFAEDHSKREVARLLECPESSVRSWIQKALEALRVCLERKGLARRDND